MNSSHAGDLLLFCYCAFARICNVASFQAQP